MYYEIEVKSLLGEKEKAEELRMVLKDKFGVGEPVKKNSQLNHYFTGSSIEHLYSKLLPLLSDSRAKELRDLLDKSKSYSLRTRQAEGKVLLVMKISIGDDSSDNGVSRAEFEESFGMTLDSLDSILLDSGFKYQAKWSRDREEYIVDEITVCLDRNAGYGYLVEFETMIDDKSKADIARKKVFDFMESCGVRELPQARLERMFSYYNANWSDYYGTDKVFNV